MTIITEVREGIAARLRTVTGIGRVHDYFRLSTHAAEANALFVAEGRLHVWFVTLAQDTPYREQRRGTCTEATLRYTIQGLYALKDADASEKAFEGVLQAVLDALRDRDGYQFGVSAVIDSGPPAVVQFDEVTWGNILNHRVLVEMTVRVHLED